MVGSNFSCSTVFSLYPYFIETTTTDIDVRLQVQLQFCNDNGFTGCCDFGRNIVVLPTTRRLNIMQDSRGKERNVVSQYVVGESSIHCACSVSTS